MRYVACALGAPKHRPAIPLLHNDRAGLRGRRDRGACYGMQACLTSPDLYQTRRRWNDTATTQVLLYGQGDHVKTSLSRLQKRLIIIIDGEGALHSRSTAEEITKLQLVLPTMCWGPNHVPA